MIHQLLRIIIFSIVLISINKANAQTDVNSEKAEYTYIIISGKVTDEHGVPLPFANLWQRNICVGTTTDIDGNYSVRFYHHISMEMAFAYLDFCTVYIDLNEYDSSKNLVINIVINRRCKIAEYNYCQDPPSGRTFPKLIQDWVQNLKKKQNENTVEPQSEIAPSPIVDLEAPNIRSPQIITKKPITNIFPNPFDNKIHITLESEITETLRLVVYDAMSREIHSESINVLIGTNEIDLNLKEKQLTNGSYFLSVFRGDKVIQTEILMRT